ncbi:MAG: DUF3489 domain-containing protein [Hyphomonadaceae bacterium]
MTSIPITAVKAGTRQAEFLEHLKGEGASVETLAAAMGWLPHSVRAALTGLRKRGVPIERIAGEPGEPSIYRFKPETAGRKRRARQ